MNSHFQRNGATIVCVILVLIILGGVAYAPTVGLRWKENTTQAIAQTFSGFALVALLVERVIEVFVSIWQRPQVDQLMQQIEFQKSLQINRRRDLDDLKAQLAVAGIDDTERKDLKGKQVKKQLELSDSETETENLQKVLVPFQGQTRRVATWIGMVVGVLAAAVGFRVLDNLVETNSLVNTAHQPPSMSEMELSAGSSASTEATELQTTSDVANESFRAPYYQYVFFVLVDTLLTGGVLAGGSKLVHEIFSLYERVMDSSRSMVDSRRISQSTPPIPPS